MSLSSSLLLVHICGATIGLLSGFLAIVLRKGSGLHAAAGTVFFVSMLSMSSTGAVIAAFFKPNGANLVASILTLYLVSTAWMAARRREASVSVFDWAALLVISANGLRAVTWGFEAVSNGGSKDHMPAAIYFIFGAVALLHASSDVRMIRRGGVTGSSRIVRHLWRMSFALMIATFSLYPGQAKLFSTAFRKTSLPFMPHILLVGMIIFYLVRVSRSKAQKRKRAVVATATQSKLAA